MFDFDQERLRQNPGEQLQEFFLHRYTPPEDRPDSPQSFLEHIDADFLAGGTIAEYFYKSCVNYVVRRFITTAQHLKRKNPSNIEGFDQDLRDYISYYTEFRGNDATRLASILADCVEASEVRSIPAGERNVITTRAKRSNWHCYICGKSLNPDSYEDSDQDPTRITSDPNTSNETVAPWNKPTVDHMWPKTLGGLSDRSNLNWACGDCNNNLKSDYMDASDFHFEEIALKCVNGEDYEGSEKKKLYEMAVFARTNFCCGACKKPARERGKLFLGRRETDQSWHFFNLIGYCEVCLTSGRINER